MPTHLTENDIKVLRVLAEDAEQNPGGDMTLDQIATATDLTTDDCRTSSQVLNELGAFKNPSINWVEEHLCFFPSPQAIMLYRRIQADLANQEARANEAPDVVEQIKRRFRTNPKTAWAIIIVIAFTVLSTFLNQLIELIEKIISWIPGGK